MKRYGSRLYALWLENEEQLATEMFQSQIYRIGKNCRVRHPFYLNNPKHITIGESFTACPGLRIEAWDQYLQYKYSPKIIIGNNVIINFYVHIGAIGTIELGDNVLIGSGVLITDHSHGHLESDDLATPVNARPLHYKGPTIIQDNVWIGEGACILGGLQIGCNAIIGANAVVTKDVAPGEVVAGVPARPLRYRPSFPEPG